MTDYCNDNDIKFDYKRLLVSGTSASKILLATPLLQWYLRNNCEITKVYQKIKYQPKTSFIDTMTKYQIGGKNPSLGKIINWSVIVLTDLCSCPSTPMLNI